MNWSYLHKGTPFHCCQRSARAPFSRPRSSTRLLPCPSQRSRRDRGEDFFLIPWSFRGKNEEFLGFFTFFETNIKDETRLWLSPRSRRDRGEEFLLIPRSFRGRCEDLADLCHPGLVFSQTFSYYFKAMMMLLLHSQRHNGSIEFNVNVMTRNNGEHQCSPYDPGIQKWPFFLFLTPEKKINSMELMIYSLKMTVSLKWKKFLGSGTKRKVISESLGHKENVGVLRCFGSWHWHWILIDPMWLQKIFY